MEETNFNDDQFRAGVSLCKSLRVLDINHCDVVDDSLAVVAASCRMLNRLNIASCIQLTDACIPVFNGEDERLKAYDHNPPWEEGEEDALR